MTTKSQFGFTDKSLRGLEKQWGEKAVHRALMNAADEIGAHTAGEVSEVTPTNKNPQRGQTRGRLAAGWSHKVKRRGSGADIIIGNRVKYGPYVNFGTGTFAGKGRIFPKKKGGVMVFMGKRGMVFARSIKGQEGQGFAEKGLGKAARDIPRIAARQIEQDLGKK